MAYEFSFSCLFQTGKEVTVRLIPCLAESSFKEARFSPSKSNIRQQWYNKDCQEGESAIGCPLKWHAGGEWGKGDLGGGGGGREGGV